MCIGINKLLLLKSFLVERVQCMSLKRSLEDEDQENNWGRKKHKIECWLIRKSGNKGVMENAISRKGYGCTRGLRRKGRVKKYKGIGRRKKKIGGEESTEIDFFGVLVDVPIQRSVDAKGYGGCPTTATQGP
ncbi:hypothetical protein ERO13_D09G121332v2 [Gossypium hirsutum]|nr:hypothetical protein ERO13_D09G121332v2 [Gossypium hirsutum]